MSYHQGLGEEKPVEEKPTEEKPKGGGVVLAGVVAFALWALLSK